VMNPRLMSNNTLSLQI